MLTLAIVLGAVVVLWGVLLALDALERRRERVSLQRYLAEMEIRDIKRGTIRQMFEMERRLGHQAVREMAEDVHRIDDVEVIEGEVTS